MNIVLIEPSKTFQKMLSALCSECGFDIHVFEGGAAALDWLHANSCDLVCVSMYLEGMSGIEFCRTLRQSQSHQSLPVIMITSTHDERIYVDALRAGMAEVFNKSDLQQLAAFLSLFTRQHTHCNKLRGRVLLVENSASLAKYIKSLLTEAGLTVDYSNAVQPAYEAFKDNDYDLVITDIILVGRQNGLYLVREIRRAKGHKSLVPILAMSGSDDNSHKIELLRNGANDYLLKPCCAEELLVRVSNLITHKQLFDKIEQQRAQLYRLAVTDHLTQLCNRHFIAEMVPKLISEARRHQTPLSIILLDIDRFKKVNDDYGHDIGDLVLAQTAALLKSDCREGDLAARFGGEEFMLVMTHCNEAQAAQKAEQYRIAIAQSCPADIQISASFGVAGLPIESECSFATLFKNADRAVYQAKAKGRNQVISASTLADLDQEVEVA